jgi:hypothetical protein
MITRTCRWIATGMLALLGIARCTGGLVVLHGGSGAAGSAARPDAPVGLVGVGLVLVGLGCLGASVVTARRHRLALWIGAGALAAFIVGGLVNGALLFGSPRAAGVVGNTIYALVAGIILWQGTRRGPTT